MKPNSPTTETSGEVPERIVITWPRNPADDRWWFYPSEMTGVEFVRVGSHASAEESATQMCASCQSAWPTRDVVNALIRWADHLRNTHNCDCHGYEELIAAVEQAHAALIAPHLNASPSHAEASASITRTTGLLIAALDRAEIAEAKVAELTTCETCQKPAAIHACHNHAIVS